MKSIEVVQKGNQAGGSIVGGNQTNTEVHNHYERPRFGELDLLIESFKRDCEGKKEAQQLIEDLLHLNTPKANEKVIGLEAKLKDAGREELIAHGADVKELFTKKLFRHTFSESAQKIYVYLLSEVSTQFQFAVLPRIKAGASNEEISNLINDEIITKIQERIGSHRFVLDIYSREISGMLFYLTGMCHLNWK